MIRFQFKPRRAIFGLINHGNKLDEIIEFLKPTGRRTKIFANLEEMKHFLVQPSIKKDSVILIISFVDAYDLREQLNAYPSIHSIIIYYYQKVFYERWVTTISKLKTILRKPEDLRRELEQNYLCRTESTASIREVIALRDHYEMETFVHIDLNVSIRYYVSKLLINYLTRAPEPIVDRNELIEKLYQRFSDDPINTEVYENFFRQYDMTDATQCILSNNFIPQFLSDAFSNMDVESLLLHSCLLRDTKQQFEECQHDAPLDVYFGQTITIEVLNKLRKRLGQHIVCSSFLLTTTNRSFATQFDDDARLPNTGKTCVLYHISADPATVSNQWFAFAHRLEQSRDEERIIFMIGSLFRIDQIEDAEDATTIVHMTLCDDDNNMTNRSLFNDYTQRYMRNDEFSLIKFMRLLIDLAYIISISDFVAFADQYLTHLLSTLPQDDQKRVEIYDLLGLIEFREKNLDESIVWFEKSIEMQSSEKLVPTRTLIKSYEKLAQVYYEQKNFKKAIDYTEKECKVIVELGIDIEPDLRIARIRLASIYESMAEYKKALSLYVETLGLMMKHQCEDQAAFAFVYHKLGNLYQIHRQLTLALGFYQSALEVQEKAYSYVNVHVANTYKSLAILYSQLSQEDKATECFGKAAAIYGALKMKDQPSRAEIKRMLDSDQQPPLT